MPESIESVAIPRATPGEILKNRSNPNHPGKFFGRIPHPRAISLVKFVEAGQIFQLLLLSNLKKLPDIEISKGIVLFTQWKGIKKKLKYILDRTERLLITIFISQNNLLRDRVQSVSWILAEFYFSRGLQRLYTGTCIILQKTINGFLCLLIVFLKSKTYQLILKDVIKLNRNLR